MKNWWLYSGFQLWLALSLSGCLSTLVIMPASAQVKSENNIESRTSSNLTPLLKVGRGDAKGGLRRSNSPIIRQLSEVEPPITNAQLLLVQSPTPQITPTSEIVPITSVKANPTVQGVEIILQTTFGTQLQVTNRSIGNNFIADISGGQLRLASGEAFTFRSEKPSAGKRS